MRELTGLEGREGKPGVPVVFAMTGDVMEKVYVFRRGYIGLPKGPCGPLKG